MSKSVHRLRRLMTAVVGIVALTTLGLAGPAAAAPGDPAYNEKSMRLTAFPNPGNHACVSRTIYLSEHYYARRLYIKRDSTANPYSEVYAGRIFLGAGNYTWTDCIQGTSRETYIHTQTLNPDNPDWNNSVWSFEADLKPTRCSGCDFTFGGSLVWN